MSTFKALLIKDFHTHKKTLLVPVWLVLGLYAFAGGAMIYASTQGVNNFVFAGINTHLMQNPDLSKAISFALQIGLFLGFLGLFFGIPMLIISSTLLNSDVKHKCELFHRSQPISVWKLTASRYLVGIGGICLMGLVFGIFQYLFSNLLLVIFTPIKVDWWLALNGFLLGWWHLTISGFVLGSICFLLSAIFRDNALGKGALFVGCIQSAIMILNYIFGQEIPHLIKGIANLVMSNIWDITRTFPTMQYGIQIGSQVQTSGDISAFSLPPLFLTTLWSSLLTWGVALKIAVCIVLYILATCIYQRREVQF